MFVETCDDEVWDDETGDLVDEDQDKIHDSLEVTKLDKRADWTEHREHVFSPFHCSLLFWQLNKNTTLNISFKIFPL